MAAEWCTPLLRAEGITSVILWHKWCRTHHPDRWQSSPDLAAITEKFQAVSADYARCSPKWIQKAPSEFKKGYCIARLETGACCGMRECNRGSALCIGHFFAGYKP